jgi:YD repeat-containing protein
MLKKDFVRDGNRKIIASVTTGFSDKTSTVRDDQNRLTGRTNQRFNTTRDERGKLVSINSSDPGLLIRKK